MSSRTRTTLDTTGPDHPAQDRILADYQNLLRVPGFWRMAVIGMTSKLAASMTGLSLLLLVSSSHSYGTAGLAVSCSTLGQGLTAPLRGRLIDRLPVRPVLFSCLAVNLTAVIAVITAMTVAVSRWWAVPLRSSCLRSPPGTGWGLWPRPRYASCWRPTPCSSRG
ncbi:hypothetical protein [Streptomyces sp. NPDC005828]|uniref:hypothetical protein n=1 Tax=Streptomyces sp. NPDC005828 TaxID=3157071 RepID=UPI0033E115B7